MRCTTQPADGGAEFPIRIGVSSCLLGHAVRYDAGHKRDSFLVDIFGRYVQWVPVCPEVELGLGVPRPTLCLARDGDDIRLIMPSSGADFTEAMRRYAEKRAAQLAAESLCGYVFKKGSPSCGMERVKVYGAHAVPAKSGRGLFADALMRRLPNLPVEEEGRLNDPRRRENFVERVFAYHRLQSFFRPRWSVSGLVALYTAHKLQLMAHAPKAYKELGQLVAHAKSIPRAQLRSQYESACMHALAVPATRRRQVNVLQHILGYFSPQLGAGARQELLSLIDDYRAELVPLVVPLTLMRHYVRRFRVADLDAQTYLEPHPKELMLRNHA